MSSPRAQVAGPTLRQGERVLAFVRVHWLPVAAVVGGVVARLVFWFVTDRKYEDALITVAHAQNAAAGNGLVHHLGETEPQHGFTSALSVLVPLVGELVAPGRGITTLRMASLVAFVATIAFAYLLTRRLGLGLLPTAFVLAYLAFDQNQIFYGMAGMETQIAVAVLLAAAWLVWDGRPAAAGIALGLCVLARPDFLAFVVPALAYLAWRRRSDLGRVALAAGLMVLPWLAFTTLYYGSPVPATIRAKATRYVEWPSLGDGPGAWFEFLWEPIRFHDLFWQRFAPFFESAPVTKAPISSFFLANVAFVLVVLAIGGAWTLRRRAGWWPAMAAVVIFLVYAVEWLPDKYYDWYWPPFIALFMITAAVGLQGLGLHFPRTGAALAVALAVLFAVHMPFTFPLDERTQQIEDRVRTPLGYWLRDNVPAGEAVVAESAGYFGYYGGVLLWDYPGLTSPAAREALAEVPQSQNSLSKLIELKRPPWVVLRPFELDALRQEFPQIAGQYTEVHRVALPPGDPSLDRWGTSYLNIDTDFMVLRRAGRSGRR